jgi:hypothetical protein
MPPVRRPLNSGVVVLSLPETVVGRHPDGWNRGGGSTGQAGVHKLLRGYNAFNGNNNAALLMAEIVYRFRGGFEVEG